MQLINNLCYSGAVAWVVLGAGDDEAMKGERLTFDQLQPLLEMLRIRKPSSDHLTQEDAVAEDINLRGVRIAGNTGVYLWKCFRGRVYDGSLSSCLRQTG